MSAAPAVTKQPWLTFVFQGQLATMPTRYRFQLYADWTCIFGPSGSGKTTLLKLFAGLLPQTDGICNVHGRELRHTPAHQRRIALVDQRSSVFPHLSVRDNVAFAHPRSQSSGGSRPGTENASAHLASTLERFDLLRLTRSRAGQLSGGEAQRVALARAVYSEPDVLLLDETFSGLDRGARDHLRAQLRSIQAERAERGEPMPIVSVSHDVGEVFASADDVLRIDRGCVVAQGPAAEVLAAERAALLATLLTTD